MTRYPEHLIELMENLKKLPGVGSRSAERFAFQLLDWSEEELTCFAKALSSAKEKLKICDNCGCLMDNQSCSFCHDNTRNSAVMCVTVHFKDVFSIEETNEFRGYYHVLGGVLSPLDGIGPENLKIAAIFDRIKELGTQEIILAIDSTLEGDATALYLKQELYPLGLTVSRLAFGIPMGSSLDFVDGGTLSRAFVGRHTF